MPTVFFENENRKVEVPVGTSLRKAAQLAGVSVHGSVNKVLNCRGFGLCGTDMVQIKPTDNITGLTFKEKLQLGDSPKERLACQVTVNGDINVNTAPAMAYGVEMLDNVKFIAAAAIFLLLFLGSVIYMGSELVGRPLF